MQARFSSLRFGTKEAYARDSVGASATSALRAVLMLHYLRTIRGGNDLYQCPRRQVGLSFEVINFSVKPAARLPIHRPDGLRPS
jgi:hypothetical protein